jgi:hypothetical protein
VSPNPKPILPVYARDLRAMVTASLAGPSPVPAVPAPGGSLQCRAQEQLGHGEQEVVALRDATGVSDPYWGAALPERVLICGLLLDLHTANVDLTGRIEVERRMVATYYWTYCRVPMSYALLRLVQERHQARSGEQLTEWLDTARRMLIGAPSLADADKRRLDLRVAALRRGAGGEWNDRTVATAEFVTDVLFLARAAASDVRRAHRIRHRHNGSISAALAYLDGEQDLVLERSLPLVMRVDSSSLVLSGSEWEQLQRFSQERTDYWSDRSLLQSSETRVPPVPSARSSLARPAMTRPPTVARSSEPAQAQNEHARDAYVRIRNSLEARVIGQPELSRALAAHGVAFVYGAVAARILLVGASGSGKTHSARALAEAVGRPYCAIDAGDLSQTGWKGLDVPDLLDGIRHSNAGSLNGAILQIDEIDKAVRQIPGIDGNTRAAREGLAGSLLALLDGKPVTPDSGYDSQIATDKVLIVGTGSFEGHFSQPPTTEQLIVWGWPKEFAVRWTDRLWLRPPDRRSAMELLRRSDRSVSARLGAMLAALELQVEVPDAVLAYVADTWLRTGTDFRTAADWVITAVMRRVVDALEAGAIVPIVLSPDDIMHALTARRAPRQPDR